MLRNLRYLEKPKLYFVNAQIWYKPALSTEKSGNEMALGQKYRPFACRD